MQKCLNKFFLVFPYAKINFSFQLIDYHNDKSILSHFLNFYNSSKMVYFVHSKLNKKLNLKIDFLDRLIEVKNRFIY